LLPVSAARPTDELDEAAVRAGLERAFEKLRAEYEESGGWLYVGPRDRDEDWGWIGPYAWSEADFTYKFARLLEEEFPRAVHLEMPINERMRSDLDPLPEGVKRRLPQYIDIVVANLESLASLDATADSAGAAFRARRHEAFIEAKWFPKASRHFEGIDRRRFLKSVPADIRRLHAHLKAGRCAVAAMLVVDDGGAFLPRLLAEAAEPDCLRAALDDVCLFPLAPPETRAHKATHAP
jgi:hypothetical protein